MYPPSGVLELELDALLAVTEETSPELTPPTRTPPTVTAPALTDGAVLIIRTTSGFLHYLIVACSHSPETVGSVLVGRSVPGAQISEVMQQKLTTPLTGACWRAALTNSRV